MQFDLFTQCDDLPVSSIHGNNPRAFAFECLRREVWEEDRVADEPSSFRALYVEIKVARDRRGYHWSTGYRGPESFNGGPVFVMREPAATLAEARALAIEKLKSRTSWPPKLQRIVERLR